MEEYSALNVRVPVAVAESVDAIASVEQRTRSGAIRVLLTEAIARRIAEHEQAGQAVAS